MTQKSETESKAIPIVIYVHGLYACYLSKKKESLLSLFSTGFDLPSSLIKSFLLGKNGHGDIALPITWKYEMNEDGEQVPIQDHDDFDLSDDFRKYY